MRIAPPIHTLPAPVAARRGISLLEVIIAMFVLAVGLLGLASLIPVAGFYMQKSTESDVSSTLGRGAFRDVLVRGMLRPVAWVYADGTPVIADPLTGAVNPMPGVVGTPPHDITCVVIDPLSVSKNLTPATASNPALRFPDVAFQPVGAPILPRLTLRTTAADPRLTPEATDRMFISNDDLQLIMPGNPEERSRLATSRYYGNYSWFLTVAPSIDELAAPLAAKRYTVSTVVVFKRQLPLGLTPIAGEAPPERTLFCTFPFPTASKTAPSFVAFGGGEVELSAPTATNSGVVPTADWLKVKPGQWIMLYTLKSYWDRNDASVPLHAQPVLNWYRITAVGDVNILGSGRSVTLAGPDWIWPIDTINATPIIYMSDADPKAGATVYAAVVDDVVGVYQKTVELDGASLWAN